MVLAFSQRLLHCSLSEHYERWCCEIVGSMYHALQVDEVDVAKAELRFNQSQSMNYN
jgi:hypothetical protein